MIRIAGTVARAEGGAEHRTDQRAAERAVLRDVTAPMSAGAAGYFRTAAGALTFTATANTPLPHLAIFWRKMIELRMVIWVLPTTLFTARRTLAADVAYRRFDVSRIDHAPAPRLVVRPAMRVGGQGVIWGNTNFDATGVYVAYLSHTRRPPRNSDQVFEQAKASETLVHEVAVHALGFVHGARDHYDGWPDRVRTDPQERARYQSLLDPRLFGARALRRDMNPARIRAGVVLEREAYNGVLAHHPHAQHHDYYDASHDDHEQQADFVDGLRVPNE